MTPTTDPPQQTPRQRNWAPWLGLLFAVAAMLSNAAFFLGLPGPKLIAWLGVVLTIAAIVCAVIGVMRAFRKPQVYGGKVSSPILGVLSLLICGLVAIAAVTSRALPSSAAAPQVGQKVPDFTLADTNGNKVSLDQLLGKPDAATKTVSLVAPPKEVTEKLGKADSSTSASANTSAGQTVPVGMSAATPPKAVLLVFYRGYW
jgi:hypothetical protein